MSSASSALPPDSIGVLSSIQRRSLRHFRAQVEDWYDSCRELTDWEDRNLVDEPTADHLAEHRRILNELDQVGQWLSRAAQNPDFPDSETAKLVEWTLQDIKDRRALWHGTLPQREREEILASIFNES